MSSAFPDQAIDPPEPPPRTAHELYEEAWNQLSDPDYLQDDVARCAIEDFNRRIILAIAQANRYDECEMGRELKKYIDELLKDTARAFV